MVILRIRLGVEDRKKKIHDRIDLSLVHKVDYEEKTTTSLKNFLCISEKSNDSDDEELQLKTIHQINQFVMEQSLKTSFFDPSFFRHISQFIYFIFLLLLHWRKIQS